MLLGAASLLAARRELLRRDVVFCFQPAEEGGGGARRLIEEGVLETTGVGAAYALHLWSPAPVGTVLLRQGPIMAGSDEFTARVIGRAGHGALPHHAADPIVAVAQGIVALQVVVARNVDPVEAAVVTVGSVHAGSAPNAIPEEARLDGTMRCFRREVRDLLRERVREVLEGSARAHRCRVEFELRPGYPAVVNDPEAVAHARKIAREVVGDSAVLEHPPMAASEDFSCFLERVPGAFLFLGAGNEARGITAPHHSPDFDIDEAALPIGVELLVRLAIDGR
jgi:amidohydrolase